MIAGGEGKPLVLRHPLATELASMHLLPLLECIPMHSRSFGLALAACFDRMFPLPSIGSVEQKVDTESGPWYGDGECRYDATLDVTSLQRFPLLPSI